MIMIILIIIIIGLIRKGSFRAENSSTKKSRYSGDDI